MTTYFGISSAHDSSICFYKNGEIKYFIKEERLTRKKRDKIPIRSLYEFDTEDDIVYSFSSTYQDKNFYEMSKSWMLKKYNVIRDYDLSNDHHLTHANLAFYNSGFDKALVVVVDRNGSIANLNNVIFDLCRESESVYIAEYPNKFEPIYKNYWMYDSNAYHFIKQASKAYPNCEFSAKSMQSIVKVYESATSLILENILENGKTMGLSAYGDKNLEYKQFFTHDAIAKDYLFGHEGRDGDQAVINLDLQKNCTKVLTKDNYQLYADYAWQVQKQTQEALAYIVDKYVQQTGIKNVCITGGYGLNVVANYYLIKQFPYINFFFEPLADDSGNSIGAAMKAYRDETLDNTIYPLTNTFYSGKKHSLNGIQGDSVTSKDVAQILFSGKSVAIFQGLSEAGPRALGNRSILFDPRDKNAKDKVNQIKKREWYRPFACMVLEEDSHKYFEMGHIESSRYMTISFPAKQLALDTIPGVIHVDNTCRIQTIDNSNINIFNLLKDFKNLSGIGVLLNTSFNLAGEPLVETPKEALKTLENSNLDYVWFPEINKIVSKIHLGSIDLFS